MTLLSIFKCFRRETYGNNGDESLFLPWSFMEFCVSFFLSIFPEHIHSYYWIYIYIYLVFGELGKFLPSKSLCSSGMLISVIVFIMVGSYWNHLYMSTSPTAYELWLLQSVSLLKGFAESVFKVHRKWDAKKKVKYNLWIN